MADLQIEYDDSHGDAMEKINAALKDHGLGFVYNEDESGDGFVVYDLAEA